MTSIKPNITLDVDSIRILRGDKTLQRYQEAADTLISDSALQRLSADISVASRHLPEWEQVASPDTYVDEATVKFHDQNRQPLILKRGYGFLFQESPWRFLRRVLKEAVTQN